MAIVVEEEKKQGGWIGAIIWIVILAVAGYGVYFLFFKSPAFVDVAIPPNFKDATTLVSVELKPDEVLNSPQFKNLNQYYAPSALPAGGKQNPFLGF